MMQVMLQHQKKVQVMQVMQVMLQLKTVVKKEKEVRKVERKQVIHVKVNAVQENVIQHHVDWICLVKIALKNVPLNA